MGEGIVITPLEMFTMENLKMERLKAQEFINGVMVMHIMEN